MVVKGFVREIGTMALRSISGTTVMNWLSPTIGRATPSVNGADVGDDDILERGGLGSRPACTAAPRATTLSGSSGQRHASEQARDEAAHHGHPRRAADQDDLIDLGGIEPRIRHGALDRRPEATQQRQGCSLEGVTMMVPEALGCRARARSALSCST